MIQFEACGDCVDVCVNYETGEPMSEHQIQFHIPAMTTQHPELSEQITFIEIAEEATFSHSLCHGCGSPLSGDRRTVTVHSPKD